MKKVLITGANKGIGFGIAKAMGKRGYEVLVGSRDAERGAVAVTQLQADGITAQQVTIDLADPATITTAAATVGAIDILINNAGITGNIKSERSDLDMEKSPFDYTNDDLRAAMDINFLGTHNVITAFLPNLAADGKILNVSVPVTNPYWQPLAHVTSKAAQNVMTMAFAREFEKTNSQRQIFAVLPGAVATDLNGTTPGDFGHMHVVSPDDAGENIVSFLFDGKNHNGHLVQFDGKEVTTYETQLFGE